MRYFPVLRIYTNDIYTINGIYLQEKKGFYIPEKKDYRDLTP